MNIDIDKLNNEEINELLAKLEQAGYSLNIADKARIMAQEINKLEIRKPQVVDKFRRAIYQIADEATVNYYYTGGEGVTQRTTKDVPVEKQEEYRRIVSGILKVIKPYCSRKNVLERARELDKIRYMAMAENGKIMPMPGTATWAIEKEVDE